MKNLLFSGTLPNNRHFRQQGFKKVFIFATLKLVFFLFFSRNSGKLIFVTVPTRNKHIFVRPRKVCFLWEKWLFGKKVLILVLWVCLLWVGQVFNDNSFCLVSLEMSIRIALRTFWKIKLNFFLRTVIRKLYRRILSLRSLSLKIQIFQRAQGF